ncbi:MAG TPA: Lrp/AsnC family transcriptional regulator [Solirubrobacterales bacterium]|nr:Lrp/AsnC family transcriptional regulator [Solirubrobacterales bacterium]
MALSDDQKAILRLLAQRGEQGYEDLAALLGIGVDDVHARAKAAATQLEAEGIPAPSIPEPPGGGEGAGGSSGEDRPQHTGFGTDVSRLPEPSPEGPPAASLSKGPAKPPLRKELKLLENRGLWAILAGAAIVVLFVVILFVGGGGGSDSSTTETTTASESGAEAAERAAASGRETKAVLNPVDGSEARGEALFGRVKKSLALQVFAEGLEPTGKSESYTIWLAASPDKMLPLASTEVKADGRIKAQVEVPVEILAYLANETFGQIAVTRTDESRLKASLAKATKEKKAPLYTGTEVLRGTVTGPIVGAASRKGSE